jgi:hypothetical protein
MLRPSELERVKMVDNPQEPKQSTLKIQRVDLPELAETFGDSIDQVFFDGQNVRINFGVTRFDQLEQTASPSARRYPACRLVLTPGAAVELMNQLQKLMTVMIQAGVLKPTAQPPGVKSANEVIK